MDSVTQAVLGAAVGEAVGGSRAGRRAALWGAALGTVPDLDVLANPFISEVQALALHRGFTHSLVFAVLAAPLFGALMARMHPNTDVSWRRWSVLAGLAFLTHLLLDACTTYGTQVFWPFSDYPVSLGAIFIIDPLYTVPLLVGLVVALVLPAGSRRRRAANAAGLVVSTLYLAFTFSGKAAATAAFREAFQAQGVPAARLMTTPSPLNAVLWTGIALHRDTLYVGLYSLLDDDRRITFERIPRHSHRLAPYAGDPVLERLRWFSRGYYTASEGPAAPVFHDVRFGRTDLWLGGDGRFLFSFALVPEPGRPRQLRGFRQQDFGFEVEEGLLRGYRARILGRASAAPGVGARRP